ncbi:MAG: carboxypeptidase-like regulatory domain-containing protein [Myxococcota bacterium]|nr:carboxypeptidase regulatory-like domain-containing protein [Deltaproteobacteria bacterium]MDQ3339209.1 carboxypeptidase-like regulatory domain-containing protein [Myxococcota bacterium]
MTKMRLGLFVLSIALAACGPSKGRGDDGDDGDDAGPGKEDAYCPTAITGKVFAPNGTLPLHNVTVYAPISDPEPFPVGVQCSKCASTLPGGAYASTSSDPTGSFRLEGIPAGTDIPIIVTTGKWRRKIIVPTVAACADTAIPDGVFRLPKNRTEGEMPRIAMVTGQCDGLACILAQLGIDSAEFGSSSAGPQAVTFYNGGGGAAPGSPQAAPSLWANLNELKKFDVVINSCECTENNGNKGSPDQLRQYADIGGRVLGSHFHYTWTKNLIPAWQSTATWNGGTSGTPDLVDMTHGTGMALGQWLIAVGASTTLGQIQLGTKTPNASVVGAATTRWLYASGANPTTHYLSFNTPVGVPIENQCGKVVYAGMHVSEPGSGNTVNASFPSGCNLNNFTPEEKAFVFLLFDLQSCVGQIF